MTFSFRKFLAEASDSDVGRKEFKLRRAQLLKRLRQKYSFAPYNDRVPGDEAYITVCEIPKSKLNPEPYDLNLILMIDYRRFMILHAMIMSQKKDFDDTWVQIELPRDFKDDDLLGMTVDQAEDAFDRAAKYFKTDVAENTPWYQVIAFLYNHGVKSEMTLQRTLNARNWDFNKLLNSDPHEWAMLLKLVPENGHCDRVKLEKLKFRFISNNPDELEMPDDI